jgi:hypothetical protein
MTPFIPNAEHNHPEPMAWVSETNCPPRLRISSAVAAETLNRLVNGFFGLSRTLPGATTPAVDFEVAITDGSAQNLTQSSGDLGRYSADHRLDPRRPADRTVNSMAGT